MPRIAIATVQHRSRKDQWVAVVRGRVISRARPGCAYGYESMKAVCEGYNNATMARLAERKALPAREG